MLCDAHDVSVVKLSDDRQLPQDIRVFFQPIQQTLEVLYNVSQFQMIGLINQCKYYQDHVLKLQAKCAKQRQLLFQAKNELDSIPKLKSKITELESQLKKMKNEETPFFSKQNFGNGKRGLPNSSSSSYQRSSTSIFSNVKNQFRHPPATVDLTLEDDDDIEGNFVKKLRQNSNLKKTYPTTSSNIVAESTHIDNVLPDDSFYDNRNLRQTVSRQVPSRNSITSDMPNDINDKMQFPTALEKLRIVRRNNTLSSTPTKNSFSESQGGILNHMRSSGATNIRETFKTQSSIPSIRRSSTSQQPLSKFQNSGADELNTSTNKIRRIR